MHQASKALYVFFTLGATAFLTYVFDNGVFFLIGLAVVTVIGRLGGGSGRSRRQTPKRNVADELAAFQRSHIEIDSPHLQHRCGSCSHWAGAKTTHKSLRGIYVHKQQIGDCTFRRPGSPRLDLKATAGQACADYVS